MNLPLHLGLLGAFEAGLIAVLVGLICYGLWRWILRSATHPVPRTLGWASLSAMIVAAGIDAWHLFYLAVMRMESPLYARMALQGIHDADSLATRVVFEFLGAALGVLLGWQWFSGGMGGRQGPA
ncbi:hypothetical protein DT603_06525 [Pseudoxanthomonas gei]|uniref:Uncharacterized protein n=1 Tax=Pseudoxanthomonas gei TaxID=1383030 RepID=A0ABX0AAJ0_9GAMM|nr:hypothetical protein [Pseudoxanthomonas gei]